MAFTVQNDAGNVVGANALISVAEFDAYHTDRGIAVGSYTTPQKQTSIVRATDYMAGRFAFIGTAISIDTCWPRSNAYVGEVLVSGIPRAVKNACAEYALVDLLGTPLWKDPAADASGRIVISESKTVGDLSKSTTYAQPGARPSGYPSYPAGDRPLVRAGLVQSSNMVLRA